MRQRFLSGISHATCTVYIVTTDGPAGRSGMTVSAMSSVSADTPNPTLLVCMNHDSSTASKVIKISVFCVNVLRDDTRRRNGHRTLFSRLEPTVESTYVSYWADYQDGCETVQFGLDFALGEASFFRRSCRKMMVNHTVPYNFELDIPATLPNSNNEILTINGLSMADWL